jgi:hypothetical protein
MPHNGSPEHVQMLPRLEGERERNSQAKGEKEIDRERNKY